MNTAQRIQKKWNATQTEMAQRLAITPSTAKRWLAGGTPKDIGSLLLKIADEDSSFDARKLSVEKRNKYTAPDWVFYLMRRFGDYRLAQFARRLNLNFSTVRAWIDSEFKPLKGAAEALLLYAYHHPEHFPTK